MLNDLKKIVLFLERIQLQYKHTVLHSKELKEQLKRIEDFSGILDEINLKLNTVDINNICEVAEALFFVRSKLIDCDNRLNDIIELIEKTVQKYDLNC